jgi:23S rRNA (adenine2030-N6)-methyltransferase
MNYRHIYHAGGFSDVVKHIVLILLLKHMKLKDKPFAVLDAFAGLGVYDINSDAAQKTCESDNGIKRLLGKDFSDELILKYLDIVRLYDGYYPGSPLIIANTIGHRNRLIACELHKEDYMVLKKNMKQIAQIHCIDAYKAIKAFWPPAENRGLIVLDPAFEVINEFEKIIHTLHLIKKRFTSGMTMLWYPIKDKKVIENFYASYKQIGYSETLILEFDISKLQSTGLQKCGILISNPPDILQTLTKTMSELTISSYKDLAEYKIQLI